MQLTNHLTRNDMQYKRLPVPNRRGQSGFTLVEFMVAITLSLVVLVALSALFVSSSRSRDELQKANEQIENGRYATQVLSDDLQLAGYYGEFDIASAITAGLAVPAAKPDPCATTLATLNTNFPVHIQGYDNANGGLSCLPADYRANTDVIVIRRASTCANCANAVANAPYFQASLCNQAAELGSTNPANWYRLAVGQGNANLDRTGIACNNPAVTRRLMTHIYFIANNNQAGDGIPTLKRAELRGSNFTTTALVEGIQDLQVEYGIDTDNDGIPENFTTVPDTFGGCTPGPPANPAGCVIDNWRNVVAAKVHLLARSTEDTFGHEDEKTYFLGLDAANAAISVGPFNDGFKRHVFSTLIRLNNPAERLRQ